MLPSVFFRRNVVTSIHEDTIGIRPHDVVRVDSMMSGSNYPHNASTLLDSRKIPGSPGGRAGRRTA
jgi:hypothetical protein